MIDSAAEASLEILLERLRDGDESAAQQVFATYEPYLRMLVRRQLSAGLRAKFDSLDVVQSVLADVFQGFREAGWRFPDAAHLRAFLIKVTRNRFLDRVRQHQPQVQREQSLHEADSVVLPRPPQRPVREVVRAEELWKVLLILCPPQHQEILRLKQQGCKLAEIADRTGLHQGSVRRILYELARKLSSGVE